MLVTFHSKSCANIIMFGDSAVALLKLMGHSGSVPGALLAADVSAALTRLLQKLDTTKPVEDCEQSDASNAEPPPRVEHSLRAWPLIQMLSAAVDQQSDVMWEEGLI
jgi:hypothetical protein